MIDIDLSALKKQMNGGGDRVKEEHDKSKKAKNKNGFGKNNSYSGKGNYGSKRENRKNDRNGQDASVLTSPYNFVPFHTETIPVSPSQMEVRGNMSEDLLTGEISYTMTAETPVFVDDGTDAHDFVRNARNKYALPGSTVRGLIRNNVQILGLSGFEDDIDDYRLMYRNVAGGAERVRYNDVLGSKPVPVTPGAKPLSILTNVKAGYIAKSGEDYVIYHTKVDKISESLQEMNYYVLSERAIAKDLSGGAVSFPYFVNHPEVLQHDVSKGFQKNGYGKGTQYKGTQNSSYQPGYYPVSYQVKNLKNVTAVEEPEVLKEKGTLVCTGSMQMKKALYIVPEIDKTKPVIQVPRQDEKAFRIDFEKKKNTLKRFKNTEFFNLPKGDEVKPVFYIFLDKRLYLGFTPRLRLFYDYTVKEGYRQRTSRFDYAKSLFGTIDGKVGYKSKVSFSDAIAYRPVKRETEHKVILAEPKPTSYLDYLKQNRGETTYNTDGFELRGVKQYWLHRGIDIPKFPMQNDKVYSNIKALPKGTVFKGNIRFQNLTRTELGLLLWSLRLERNSWMNVGKAKSYGFGAVSVSDIIVKTVDLQKAYGLNVSLLADPFETQDADRLIEAYKQEVTAKLGRQIEKLQTIRDFFIMKDSTCIPDKNQLQYMSLKAYQSRTKPLPEVQQVMANKDKGQKH